MIIDLNKINGSIKYLAGLLFMINLFFLSYIFLNDNKQINDDDLINKVNDLVVLSENDKPIIATVTNDDLSKTNSLFKNAKIGDKVLIYSLSKKAIIFRQESQKIVEMSKLDSNIKI